VDLAYKIITLDDEVDQIKNEAYDKIKQAIQELPERVGYYINLLLISRHLERLGDHSTNIAEEVIYLVEGEIFRHAQY
jgi:phosphate transport system protein